MGFFASAIAFFSAALVLVGIARVMPAPTAVERELKPASLSAALKEVAESRALLALALALVVRGTLSDGHLQFGNIYLEQLGASTAIIGIASMLAAVVEVPGMFVADRVVRRIGATRSLLLSFLVTGGKLILVLVFPEVWSILVTRAIEGVGFSLFVIGTLKYITERAAPAHRATMLALFSVTLVALNQILGAPIGGVVFDAVGAPWLYGLAVVGNGAAFLILWGARPIQLLRGRAEGSL
jgi:PPP family 3-phenylpropionic acid transporter